MKNHLRNFFNFYFLFILLEAFFRLFLFIEDDRTKLHFFSLILILLKGILVDTCAFTFFAAWGFFFQICKTPLIVMIFLFTFFELFKLIAEYTFWREFGERFNFIAVDYLIYTKEVLNNILESYPLNKILVLIFLLSVALTFLFHKYLKWNLRNDFSKKKSLSFSILSGLIFSFFIHTTNLYFIHESDSKVEREISYNGILELFRGLYFSEIDFLDHYRTTNHRVLQSILHSEYPLAHNIFSQGLKRTIPRPLPLEEEKRFNVIQITVESLSAHFIQSFNPHRTKALTPYLDQLSKESLMFDNIYATGSRTVRGIEALTLGLPPTPGQSIVKRPGNENLHTFGNIFLERNYQVEFIYGGYAYFDNMKNFFSNNHYEVIDKTQFDEKNIHFANAWGVCDEDLFQKAIEEANRSYQLKKPFYQFILTSSNHRPFTYPDNKVELPSGESREGAVEYTDYAIGKFIQMAKNQPWFNNTIFVIVADHSAEGRGTLSIPISTYHIPLIIYSPQNIAPKVVSRVASQIDILPTIFHLLNWGYTDYSFGKNILEANEERFFSGTYQNLGYYSKGVFIELDSQKKFTTYSYTPKTKVVAPSDLESMTLVDQASSFYQSASLFWKEKKL